MTSDVVRDQLRVVVVGVGRFGALHVRAWQEAGAQVVGIVDRDVARLSEISAAYAVPVTGGDLADVLTTTRPDALIVVTDEASHADHVLTGLDAGCHIFVEKPLALTSHDASRIAEGAARAGRQVIAGQISRFGSAYVRMREAIQQGRIGQVCAMRLRRDFSRAWFESFGDRVHPAWESCIHDIDLAISMTGQPAVEVFAYASTATSDIGQSVITAVMRMADGSTATIESAWLVPDTAPGTLSGVLELSGSIIAEAEILGRTGTLRQRLLSDSLVEWTQAGATTPDLSLWPVEAGRIGGALGLEIAYARDVFLGRRPHDVIPLHEACWGVNAAEALVASLTSGKPTAVVQAAP